jgi:hypothetical protein
MVNAYLHSTDFTDNLDIKVMRLKNYQNSTFHFKDESENSLLFFSKENIESDWKNNSLDISTQSLDLTSNILDAILQREYINILKFEGFGEIQTFGRKWLHKHGVDKSFKGVIIYTHGDFAKSYYLGELPYQQISLGANTLVLLPSNTPVRRLKERVELDDGVITRVATLRVYPLPKYHFD